jgi:membrane-associated phospholipid phosphatase
MLADPFNFNIPNLADYISVLPISFYVGALYELVKSPNSETLKYFLGITASTIASDVIKRLPYPESLYKMSRRPDGAENCDYLSKMGPAKKDAPGFPSGHMTTTTFFAVYKVMENMENTPLVALLTAVVISMSWSRYYKKCHSVIQIVGGIILGGGSAFLIKKYI